MLRGGGWRGVVSMSRLGAGGVVSMLRGSLASQLGQSGRRCGVAFSEAAMSLTPSQRSRQG